MTLYVVATTLNNESIKSRLKWIDLTVEYRLLLNIETEMSTTEKYNLENLWRLFDDNETFVFRFYRFDQSNKTENNEVKQWMMLGDDGGDDGKICTKNRVVSKVVTFLFVVSRNYLIIYIIIYSIQFPSHQSLYFCMVGRGDVAFAPSSLWRSEFFPQL